MVSFSNKVGQEIRFLLQDEERSSPQKVHFLGSQSPPPLSILSMGLFWLTVIIIASVEKIALNYMKDQFWVVIEMTIPWNYQSKMLLERQTAISRLRNCTISSFKTSFLVAIQSYQSECIIRFPMTSKFKSIYPSILIVSVQIKQSGGVLLYFRWPQNPHLPFVLHQEMKQNRAIQWFPIYKWDYPKTILYIQSGWHFQLWEVRGQGLEILTIILILSCRQLVGMSETEAQRTQFTSWWWKCSIFS